jgi:hypothetical protein
VRRRKPAFDKESFMTRHSRTLIFVMTLVATLILPTGINSAYAEPVLIVSPNGRENTEGNGYTSSSDAIGPIRFQNLHPASAFASLPEGKSRIVGLSLRLDSNSASPLTIGFPDLEIRLSTTSASTLSTNFADNIGADETLVLSGDITQTLPLGGPPRGFGEAFHFDTPFEYDPSVGNLLVDMNLKGGTDRGFSFDIHGTPGVISWVQDFPPVNPLGRSFSNLLVTQFIVVPEPAALVLMVAGCGSLTFLRTRSRRSFV